MHGVHSFTGQIKSVLQSSSHATTGFFPGKNSDLGAGSAGLRCRAGGAARWWNALKRTQFESISATYAFGGGGSVSKSAGWRGSDAGQVVRPGGGFYAGQVARQGE